MSQQPTGAAPTMNNTEELVQDAQASSHNQSQVKIQALEDNLEEPSALAIAQEPESDPLKVLVELPPINNVIPMNKPEVEVE